MQLRIMRRSAHWYLAAWVCALLVFAAFAQPSLGNVIFVTKTNDVIDCMGGCSLSEAIYVATRQSSDAVGSYVTNSASGRADLNDPQEVPR